MKEEPFSLEPKSGLEGMFSLLTLLETEGPRFGFLVKESDVKGAFSRLCLSSDGVLVSASDEDLVGDVAEEAVGVALEGVFFGVGVLEKKFKRLLWAADFFFSEVFPGAFTLVVVGVDGISAKCAG